ncbi:DAK2 domain-containing protein [Nocardioides sp. zg-536]|uniref:DAK2 domain-containing protein n=1 Tax=Nocardioides faecalis TaxID=2803858 RepID=A0A938YAI3_9ACTN|nr:DAK2 domain-containing protein [Nocardioides faecalis]MBM9460446.1 DAK2 domain-containing protein [Nocardioides faecalis]MBS4751371.1 DAK2 domain-containing protein [Nocardioides faecalis]QVI59734.1 DAK2 domain-containing protein [Nocardioides faecalis]
MAEGTGHDATGAGTAISLATVARFVDVAVDALAQAREEVDALNVFPVPDGDTGTNMYLTVVAARDAIRVAMAEQEHGADSGAGRGAEPGAGDGSGLEGPMAALARGALLGARGNSGVILSEMLGAVARRIASAEPGESNARVLADGMAQASTASYAAVGEPVEGTMLTVLRAAAQAAGAVAEQPTARSSDVLAAAAAAAREALGHTPEQLEALAAAGVVDAGGRGLSVILDAAETVLTGRRPIPVTAPLGSHAIPVPQLPEAGADLSADGPAYEVMYLLDGPDDGVGVLRKRLGGLGDSVVVVGGEGLWHVHVHTDDVGAAIEAGLELGRPHRIRVIHFAEQLARQVGQAGQTGQAGQAGQSGESAPRALSGRRVVAVAAGPGLAELFQEAGAVVVPGGPGRRPSTGELLEAITGCGAREVVVLPNDEPSVRAALVAASTAEADHGARGLRVAVIPTHAQVQGLAAVAVHEPGRAFDQDVTEMTATARHVRHGAVTVAAKQAMTMAGPCEPGDALGVIAGDFAVVGDDLGAVALIVLDRLLAAGGEMVTLVHGRDGIGLAESAAAWVEESHPHVDVMVYDGGQERYPLLMSVE